MLIRGPATEADFAAILALNEESVQFLSPLTSARLQQLHAQSELHRLIEIDGAIAAFVLVFRDGAQYDSVNYRWFAQRFPRFLYVDRVVVSSRYRGRGLGVVLYETVFAYARANNFPVLACEFDIDPPNPQSAQFHARFGFTEVGRQAVVGGSKRVSLQAASPSAPQACGIGR